jgi:hypothetical protein
MLFSNSFNCLPPGGFLELCDTGFRYKSDGTAIASWKSVSQEIYEFGKKVGYSFNLYHGIYRGYIEAVGFVDVHEHWETFSANNTVIHDIGSILLLAWKREGLDDEEIRLRLARWNGLLVSEASSVKVHSICLFSLVRQ